MQSKLEKNLGQKLESYYQDQLGKKDITLMDVIKFYNKSHLPIYDENDVQKQCKGYTHNIPQYIRFAEPNNNLTKGCRSEFDDSLSLIWEKIASDQTISSVADARNTFASYIKQIQDKEKSFR